MRYCDCWWKINEIVAFCAPSKSIERLCKVFDAVKNLSKSKLKLQRSKEKRFYSLAKSWPASDKYKIGWSGFSLYTLLCLWIQPWERSIEESRTDTEVHQERIGSSRDIEIQESISKSVCKHIYMNCTPWSSSRPLYVVFCKSETVKCSLHEH